MDFTKDWRLRWFVLDYVYFLQNGLADSKNRGLEENKDSQSGWSHLAFRKVDGMSRH